MQYPNFIAERLQTVKCHNCQHEVRPTPDDISHVGLVVAHDADVRVHLGAVCPRCGSDLDQHLTRPEIRWDEMILWIAKLVGYYKGKGGQVSSRPVPADGGYRMKDFNVLDVVPGRADEDRGTSLKCVNLLHVAPGRADSPGVGLPIAMITVEHNGEVEQPMLVYMRDVKKLAVSLLGVMRHFDDDVAARILEEHYPESLEN